MKKLLLILALTLNLASAHEGHDEAPGKIKSTKGGEVLVPYGKNINIEVVKSTGILKIYPLAHKGEALDFDKIMVQATTRPSKKSQKSEKIGFKRMGEYFEAAIDLKGATHLVLEIEVSVDGKTDKFKTTVD
ncbi:MAG: hypothetical protein QE271_00025 [Bacteriovoracaceae bacterium]|nr:hypothetical protein [Bacteriovoracaceae bacterium]